MRPADLLPPGHVINDTYRVVRALGAGAMGQVYEAVQLSLNRPVALKLLSPTMGDDSDDSRQRFQRRFYLEASLCAQLAHPNVVTIFDHGRVGMSDTFFIAMELLKGETLEAYLERHPTGLSPGEAVVIATEVARGLRAAAEQGMVHRDLKPANIMLLRSENEIQLKILDFGLVKSLYSPEEDDITARGRFVGTPYYMAPEQIDQRPIDQRTDLYALGCVLFECLTGRPPFENSVITKILMAHLTTPAPSARSVRPELKLSDALAQVLARLLEKDPDRRIGSAEQLLEALKTVPEHPKATQNPTTGPIGLVLPTQQTYQLGRKLSSSPAAIVFEGTHTQMGRKVAVKVFTPRDSADATRISRSVSELAVLRSPFNVRLYDVGITEIGEHQRCFAIFEFLRGETLRALLARVGRLEPARVRRLGIQLLSALHDGHAQAIVHGALTPDHIIVSDVGKSTEFLRVFGHGLASGLVSTDSSSFVPQINPSDSSYLAPEILRGKRRSELTDLYAAAAILYESMVGEAPPLRLPESSDAPPGLPTYTPSIPPGLPEGLGAVLRKGLELRPDARFETAREFIHALETSSGNTESSHKRLITGQQDTLSSLDVELRASTRPSVWVLTDDPAFGKGALQDALRHLRQTCIVTELDANARPQLLAEIERGRVAPPWLLLFGDLHVLIEDGLLEALTVEPESSRLLISTHGNLELLQQSIARSAPTGHICLPATSEEILSEVDRMIKRSRQIRARFDRLRDALTPEDASGSLPGLRAKSSLAT